jgi:hypothetical protein
MIIRTEQLLSTADAAKRIQSVRNDLAGRSVSPRRIVQLADAGILPAIRLSDGTRVYTIEAVDRCARERNKEGGAE